MAMIGIDLGTTNSLAAAWLDGEAKLIPNALGQTMTPSAVSLSDQGVLIVGQPARDRLQTHPHLSAAFFKRSIGTNKKFQLGKKSLSAEELSALVLRSLKDDAEAWLNETVDSAVITVPAYFNDTQRYATRIAGELAGIEVKRLINEPTAAAVAYGLHDKPDFSTVLVLDLGGGTFDVSVLEMFDGVMQVHASAGDNQLGGEDFSRALGEAAAKQLSIDLKNLTSQYKHDLLRAAERTKQQLTIDRTAAFKFAYEGSVHELNFSRDDFAELAKPLTERIAKPIERALRDASLQVADLDGIVLVGGASRMPLMRSLFARLLGQLPFVQVNPDEVVAQGAAVQVGLILGDQALDEVVLTDVAPYSLGVGTVNEAATNEDDLLFSPIIERNSPIPISRQASYHTVRDGQSKLEFKVYQGEAPKVVDNVKLGALEVVVPRSRAGEEVVDVRFTYDISGLLEVEATVVSTQLTKRAIIQRETTMLSDKEIQSRLRELEHLKQHPRDDLANVSIIAQAERVYQEYLGEDRQYILECITRFEQILQRQDLVEIERARSELEGILEQFESSRL